MNARLSLWTVALALAIGVPSATTAQEPGARAAEDVKARFVGHYELVSYVTFRPNGDVVDMNYVGRIMYDAHGNMSAIGMPRDLPERARERGENVQAGFAYWARVSFDLANGIVIHHVEGSPTRGNWPGTDNVRHFSFIADGLLQLSVKDADGRTTGTLTWRKITG